MAVFEYKGFTTQGKNVAGLVDADSPAAAKAKLRKDGIFPTLLNLSGEGSASKVKEFHFSDLFGKIGIQDVANMTRQLSTLIGAHIPLVESLTALVDQTENLKLKNVISAIRDTINQGSSLANAIRLHPQIFSDMYSNMIRAGEASGNLDVVLAKLADLTEKQLALRNKVIGALAYPVLMSIMGVGIIIALFTFVIPKITGLFSSIKAALPLPTVILMATSKFLTSYWYILIILFFLAIFLFKRYTRTYEGKYKFHKLQLKLPVYGKMVRMIAIAQFSETLGTLLASGVPLLAAMDIVRVIVSNLVIQKVIKETAESISEGQGIAQPLRASGGFPAMVTNMIAIGEKTGNLEDMLLKISHTYNNEVERTITTLMSLLEPIMIAVLGLVVGFVVISILLPIFKMQQLVG